MCDTSHNSPPLEHSPSRIWLGAMLLLLQGAALLLVGAGSVPQMLRECEQDLWLYYATSAAVMSGYLPYRDFPLEYPPLALIPFALPRLVLPSHILPFSSYLWAFLAQSVLFSTLLAGTVWRTAYKHFRDISPNIPLGVYTAMALILSLLLPWRYDLFPALLTALALAAVLSGKPLRAGIWLGMGIAAKLYPVVLLPVLALYYLTMRRPGDLTRLLLGCLGVVGLCALPFAALPPGILLSFLKYHQMRGLEIESLPAGIILLAHLLGRTPVGIVYNYGAIHLVAPGAAKTIQLLPVLFLALYSLLLIRCRNEFRREWEGSGIIAPRVLTNFLLGALLTFIVANKVFSPQYVIWMLPFVPLLRPRDIALSLVIFVLTTVDFPLTFSHLMALEALPIFLINLRNFLALVLLGLLLTGSKAPESKAQVLSLATRGAYVRH